MVTSILFLFQKHLFSGIVRAKARLKALDLSDNALGPIGVEGMVDFLKSESCYSLQVRNNRVVKWNYVVY